MEAKKTLENIYNNRLIQIKRIMSESGISSYRSFAKETGIDPASLSQAFSNKGVISERAARNIEISLSLPLFSLDVETTISIDTPVYSISDLFSSKEIANYYVNTTNVDKDCFYIQTSEDIYNMCPTGSLLLFKLTTSIKDLSLNDVCIIQSDKKNILAKYKISLFQTNESTYKIHSVSLKAKCIRIDIEY